MTDIPTPILEAFDGRVTIGAPALRRALRMDDKTLRGHVRQGNIRYVLKGLGVERPRREFMLSDVLEFLQRQGRQECPSTSPATRRSTSTTSNGVELGFMARLERKRSALLKA